MGGVHRCRVPGARERGYTGCMTTLHIEHPIVDFATWKASFDRFESFRVESRVRSFEIHQPIDDSGYVTVRVEFDSVDDARALLAGLQKIWTSADAEKLGLGKPTARILERKERKSY
jgi:hypothetical protein